MLLQDLMPSPPNNSTNSNNIALKSCSTFATPSSSIHIQFQMSCDMVSSLASTSNNTLLLLRHLPPTPTPPSSIWTQPTTDPSPSAPKSTHYSRLPSRLASCTTTINIFHNVRLASDPIGVPLISSGDSLIKSFNHLLPRSSWHSSTSRRPMTLWTGIYSSPHSIITSLSSDPTFPSSAAS
jgi:hypothetical protein